MSVNPVSDFTSIDNSLRELRRSHFVARNVGRSIKARKFSDVSKQKARDLERINDGRSLSLDASTVSQIAALALEAKYPETMEQQTGDKYLKRDRLNF